MKTIDVSTWKLFSERMYSKSYINESGTLMLKTVDANDKDSVAYMDEEYRTDSIANQLGLPTVKVFERVMTSNNEAGLIFEYISDKISCSRAISKEPERLDEFMKIFANVTRKMHEITADTKLVPSFASRVFEGLELTTIFSDKEKELIRERFDKLPKDTKCLHGDLTPSNVIHSPSGNYIIDLGLLSYGNPLFDIGYLYYLSRYLPEEASQSILHLDMATLRKCWESFAKEYFGSGNIREIEEYIAPYAKFSNLTILTMDPNMPSIAQGKDFILSE